ncbi:MAG: hypothetical protein KBA55_12555, partial [Ruminococcus sp.]|nr:hypothetical protein [Ruminococcus sp.]
DGGFTKIQMKAADMNENVLVDATDASAILTFYAKSSVDNGGSSGTIELSMNNEDISDELLAKGADTVLAFSSTVTPDYVWETMFDILVNGMILSADTVGNSVTKAKKELGEKDPYMDERIASEL